jgi:hypothetical protein
VRALTSDLLQICHRRQLTQSAGCQIASKKRNRAFKKCASRFIELSAAMPNIDLQQGAAARERSESLNLRQAQDDE